MICIIGSETTKNYGLLEDLSYSSDYRIVYAKPPFLFGTVAWKIIRRFRLNRFHRTHSYMTWEKSLLRNLDRIDRIIVIDTALRRLELSFLNECRDRKPCLQIDCWLLNSTKSWTFLDPKIQCKFDSFKWNTIMTFDPHDADNHNWVYTGLRYYSYHSLPDSGKSDADLFFAGSLKGKRGQMLLHLLDCFNANDVNCRFICPRLVWHQKALAQPKGLQLIRRRVSYKRILKKMIGCNCILEVLQEGQNGSSLRYFEAVCYNKKLLTTNAEIVNYPFYDERYMKVFSSDAEIDFDWIKRREHIDYGYAGEFSPKKLFDPLQNTQVRS